ncbi:MAG: RecX family transcriptional regulator [bacterium]|nr:RecX family transcriptional regulator [bacterium]
MRITALKQQIKNTQRVSIFVDEKYSFSLSLDELVTQKLKKDQELELADVKRLKKISDDGKLRARSLEWLLNRPHSIREFKDYLYRKKADPELAAALEQEFLGKNYLNEQKFGQWLVELHQRRGKSNRAIRAELFKKGLGREMIDELMLGGGENEEQRLKELITKKRRSSRYRSDPQKLAQYLVTQGFNWQDVKQALATDQTEISP